MITLKNEQQVVDICERIDAVELQMRVAEGKDYRQLLREYERLVLDLEDLCKDS